MVQFALAFIATTLVSVQASPFLQKRIAQVIDQSLTKWQNACLAATTGSTRLQCNALAVPAFQTLLAAAGPCAQQNSADSLITFAKQQQNNEEMISLAQVFAQQPRNSPTSQSVPYCQQAPVNPELKGLYQCQWKDDNPTVFVGGLAVGATGTIPFGLNTPVSPPGSCPANRAGPIADGTQLTDITTNPGVSDSDGTPATPAIQSSASVASISTATALSTTGASNSAASLPGPTQSTSPVNEVASSSGGFQLANGQAAQKLNAQFANLAADSSCTAGENACVKGEFATCVGGKFVLSACAATLNCYALPLVNSPGTSITCDTEADAAQRIANSGATGGITG